MPLDAIACPSPYVVDGDTLRCGSIRLRLLAIDARFRSLTCAASLG